MFLRRAISRQSAHGLPSASSVCPYEIQRVIKCSSARRIQTNSNQTDVDYYDAHVSCDIQRLLAVHNRYDLYQFLRHLVLSERFHDEVKCLVEKRETVFSFSDVLTLVNAYSWNQSKDGVDMMQAYAEESYPKELDAHNNFVTQKIICDSVNEPASVLNRVLDVASTRSHLKALVLTQAELFLNRVISRGSRSVVDKVNRYIVHSSCPELRGPLLCSSWVSFYLSPYEGDHIRAANILKANERVMMPHLDLSSVSQHLLNGRQLNRYYVLLQIFAKRSHRRKTQDLLEKLFRHFYATNNFRGCLTCESLSRQLNLELPIDISYKCSVIKKSKPANSNSLDMKFIF